jgi:hypothetical protein
MEDHVLDTPLTRTFLVERYWPDVDESTARAAITSLEQVASAMTAEGTPVEHVVSILMPGDQVVFSLIQAADETVARRANERAGIPLDRVTAAVALGRHIR